MAAEADSKPVVETWNGSCHCGSVKYTLNLYISIYDQEVTSCNCSICERNGYLLIYPPHGDITWHSGKDTLKAYSFASKRLGHRFCPECGTSVCGMSELPGFFDQNTVLNVRTFEDVDIGKLKLKKVDGKSYQLPE